MKLPRQLENILCEMPRSYKQCSSLSALAHNFLTENVPCESQECLITVLIDGNIMIKIKISFLFAFLGLVLKSAIVLQDSEMS